MLMQAERSEMLSQVRALDVDFEQFKTILDEKKKEIEPLQQALGKLRNNNDEGGRGGICSSEEELNDFVCYYFKLYHIEIYLLFFRCSQVFASLFVTHQKLLNCRSIACNIASSMKASRCPRRNNFLEKLNN